MLSFKKGSFVNNNYFFFLILFCLMKKFIPILGSFKAHNKFRKVLIA